jgi:hypothetical protein
MRSAYALRGVNRLLMAFGRHREFANDRFAPTAVIPKSPIMRFYHDLAASRLSYGMAKRATIQVWDSLEKIKASRDSKEFAKIRRSAKNRQRSATALQSKACRNSSLSSIPTRQRGRQPGRLLGVCATTGSFPSCCGATFRALERR